MTRLMVPAIKYERQMREPIKERRLPPYRIITTEMLFEMFEEQGFGHSYASRFLYLPENNHRLTKWCGSDGVYYLDEGMKWFIAKYKLNYKW